MSEHTQTPKSPELTFDDLSVLQDAHKEIKDAVTAADEQGLDIVRLTDRFGTFLADKAEQFIDKPLEGPLLAMAAGADRTLHGHRNARLVELNDTGLVRYETLQALRGFIESREHMEMVPMIDETDERRQAIFEYNGIYSLVHGVGEQPLNDIDKQIVLSFALGAAAVVKDPDRQNIIHSEGMFAAIQREIGMAA